jgi:hypothetical protein
MNKEFIKFISTKEIFSWVNAAENETEKRRRIEAAKQKFLAQSNFSSVAAFNNPEIEDSNGFDFWNDERDGYPQYDGVMKVRAVVERERARLDAIAWANARNATAKANRDKRTKNLSN